MPVNQDRQGNDTNVPAAGATQVPAGGSQDNSAGGPKVDYDHWKGGLYERTVRWIANHRAARIKRVNEEYEDRALKRNDPDNTNPRLRELIRYEIKRRANIGAMQD